MFKLKSQVRVLSLISGCMLLISGIGKAAPSLPHQNESSLVVSRYVEVTPGPTNAQKNPMHMVLPHIAFRSNIKSVGQAIQFLLKDTGYKLTRHHPDKRVHKLFRLQLPKIHRNMGPLTLEQGLNTLAGEPWILAVDPINRLISYQLPDHFKQLAIAKKTNTQPELRVSNAQVQQMNRRYQRIIKAPHRKKITPNKVNKSQRTIRINHRKDTPKIMPATHRNINQLPLHQLTWSDIPKELR